MTAQPTLHRLEQLSPRAFEHPADRAATAALKSVPGLDAAVRKLIEFGYERAFRQVYLAASVKVGPRQLPDVWEVYQRSLVTLEAYRNYPTTFSAPLPAHLDDLCALEASRFDLARELFLHEEWDHFFVLFSSTDWLGHKALGRFLAGDSEARAAFLRLYRQLDGYVGWLIDHAPDALVALLSDHGQCEETHVVHVNALLRELGLVQVLRERPARVNELLAGEEGLRTTIEVPQALGALRSIPPLRASARVLKRLLRRTLNVELLTPRHALDVDRVLSRAFTPTIASRPRCPPSPGRPPCLRRCVDVRGAVWQGAGPERAGAPVRAHSRGTAVRRCPDADRRERA